MPHGYVPVNVKDAPMVNDTATPDESSVTPPPSTASPEQPESGLGAEFVSGLLGVGIAIGCVLPPLLHLVTGPLGPFIGGFVAANRVRPGVRGRIVIAGTIGTGLAAILATAAKVFVGLAGKGELPTWFPSPGTLMAIIAGAWVYAVAMAAIGTTVSMSLSRRRAAERQ